MGGIEGGGGGAWRRGGAVPGCLFPLGTSAELRSPRSIRGGSADADRQGERALLLLTAGLMSRRRGWGAAPSPLLLRGCLEGATRHPARR